MKDDKCGVAGVMRVGYLNVTNTTNSCPAPLTLYNASGKKLCGPTNTDRTKCDSFTVYTYHIPYNFVCGRAVGYGYYQNGAFYYSTITGYKTIDDAYLSGLSITNRSKDSVSTSGAMLQDIMRLVPAHITVHEQLPQVSLALTQH